MSSRRTATSTNGGSPTSDSAGPVHRTSAQSGCAASRGAGVAAARVPPRPVESMSLSWLQTSHRVGPRAQAKGGEPGRRNGPELASAAFGERFDELEVPSVASRHVPRTTTRWVNGSKARCSESAGAPGSTGARPPASPAASRGRHQAHRPQHTPTLLGSTSTRVGSDRPALDSSTSRRSPDHVARHCERTSPQTPGRRWRETLVNDGQHWLRATGEVGSRRTSLRAGRAAGRRRRRR